MARYKDYSYDQTKLIPRMFAQQIIPGTFEFALNYIVDNELYLSIFETRYHNDSTGAKAYDPAILYAGCTLKCINKAFKNDTGLIGPQYRAEKTDCIDRGHFKSYYCNVIKGN